MGTDMLAKKTKNHGMFHQFTRYGARKLNRRFWKMGAYFIYHA